MVYCLVLFTYLFFDYNFFLLNASGNIFYSLGAFNIFNMVYWFTGFFTLPFNFLFYILFNDNFQLYNALFLYSTNYSILFMFLLLSILLIYVVLILYVNFYLFTIHSVNFLLSNVSNFLLNTKRFSFFLVLDFSPLQNFYNPFFSNSNLSSNSNNVNLSLNLLKSFFFAFKNKVFFNFNVFVLFLFNLCSTVYSVLLKPLWKPLSKKTSYFGLYSSFKNKY